MVIGGGAAGIAAARRLHDGGVDCLLLEARPRLGGRAWTIDDRRSASPLDLGCGWLHSADRNPWLKIAEAQGCSIDRTPPPWSRPSAPIGFPLSEQAAFRDALVAFHQRASLAEGEPDRAAVTLLDPDCRWSGLINAVSTYVSGAELDRVSVRDFARYDDSGINWRIVQGYGAAIAAHGADLRVMFGCKVRQIDHSGRRLRVETSNGAITADAIIMTLPSTVLAEDELLFRPALLEKVEAAAGLPLGLADKLFMSLAGAEEFDKDTRLFGRTDRVGTGAYHFRPFGRAQIEAYFGGTLAAELEAGGESAFVEFAVAELVALFGSAFARRVEPLHSYRWGLDPFSRGSYSYALPGKSDCRVALAAPVDDRLFFAGEACSVHDFSTAHGAYLTGIVAADQVIAARPGKRAP